MNQPFWPLTCFFTLVTLVALSGDASAAPRHKQIQHAKKTDAATERRHPGKVALKKAVFKKVALKKDRHAAHVAAARHRPPRRLLGRQRPHRCRVTFWR